jgi:hypothetical protein
MPSTGAGYLGCYVDTGSTAVRTLNYGAYSYSNNTNEICQSTCASAGYAYSGTEYGIQVSVCISARELNPHASASVSATTS